MSFGGVSADYGTFYRVLAVRMAPNADYKSKIASRTQLLLIAKGNLFLSPAIEDPSLRPNDEAESDYDGLLQNPSLVFVSDRYIGHYKRLDVDGLFQTILTKLSPRSECPQVLHYSVRLVIGHLNCHETETHNFYQLNRVITVRELTRAQGFPDDYQFYSKDKDVRDVCSFLLIQGLQ